MTEPPSAETDPLEAAWEEIEARWDDGEAHERAAALADALDRLGELGGRYRRIREEGGPRSEEAQRRAQAIVVRAMGRLRATPREPRRSAIEWVMLGVSITLVAAALWSMLRNFR